MVQTMAKLKVQIMVRFPRFVPVVRLTDESSWFWNDLPLPWIVVRLAELVKNKALRQRVSSRGLHDFLGFDGKILLSTVMEDEILDELTPNKGKLRSYGKLYEIEKNAEALAEAWIQIKHACNA